MAIDGGPSDVNENLVTGESMPAEKGVGDEVIAACQKRGFVEYAEPNLKVGINSVDEL